MHDAGVWECDIASALDGVRTLPEARSRLRAVREEIVCRRREGWELAGTVAEMRLLMAPGPVHSISMDLPYVPVVRPDPLTMTLHLEEWFDDAHCAVGLVRILDQIEWHLDQLESHGFRMWHSPRKAGETIMPSIWLKRPCAVDQHRVGEASDPDGGLVAAVESVAAWSRSAIELASARTWLPLQLRRFDVAHCVWTLAGLSDPEIEEAVASWLIELPGPELCAIVGDVNHITITEHGLATPSMSHPTEVLPKDPIRPALSWAFDDMPVATWW